jgi:DNA repair exonuclease SbcCD ATPase subunit
MIIKLLSLQAEGFKRLDLEREIIFPDGALLIHGRNESGKSTILEAIHYALYGMPLKPSKRASIEDILNYGSNVGFVQLNFLIGENKYEVKRKIERSKITHELRILENGGVKEIISGSRNVNKAIIEALHGIDSNALLNSCLVEQKELGKLESSQRQDRINTISTLLNLEAFTMAEQELKKLEKEKNEVLNGSLTKKGIRTELEEWKSRKEEYERASSEIKDIKLRLDEIEHEFPEIERKVSEVEEKLSVVSKIKEILGDIENLKTEYSHAHKCLEEATEMKNELEELNKKMIIQEGVHRAEEKLESIERFIGSIERDKESKEREDTYIEKLKSYLKRLEGAESTLEVMERQVGKLRKNKEQMVRNGMLGKGISVGGVIIGVILGIFLSSLFYVLAIVSAAVGIYIISKSRTEMIDAEIEKKEQDLSKLRAESYNKSEYEKGLRDKLILVTELKEKIWENAQSLFALVETLPNTPSAYRDDFNRAYPQSPTKAGKALMQSIHSDSIELTKMETRKKTIQPIVNDFENRERSVNEKKEEITRLNSEKNSIEEKFQVKIEHEKVLRNNFGELSRKEGELKNERNQKNVRMQECTNIIEKNKEALSKYEELLSMRNMLEFDLDAIGRAKKLLNLARDRVFGSVKEKIEINMRKFLPVLTAGRYSMAKIDEIEYKIEIYDKEARKMRVKGVFSGATQDQISLALRLAFALSTLPISRGVVPGFIFLDEPLSGFDEERKKGLLDLLLKGDMVKQFTQIIVISHGEQLRDEFPRDLHMDRGKVISSNI